MPGNFDEPSHTIRTELAAEAPYAAHTAGVAVPDSHDPAVYLDALAAAGCSASDVWETTYLHVLDRRGPGLHLGLRHRRPADAAGAARRPARRRSSAEFKARLRAAYPAHEHGVVLPFRRIFAVAQVPA